MTMGVAPTAYAAAASVSAILSLFVSVEIISQSIIVYTQRLNPSSPPFSKGRNSSPLWQRGVGGDFKKNMSSQLWTP
jgi:hypothetical protein